MMLRRIILAATAAAGLVLGLGACSDDTTTVVGTQPVVSEVTVSQDIVDASSTLTASVTASGSNLTYLWRADAGTFATPNAATTTWTAPATPGVYTLRVTVTGGSNLSTSVAKAVGVEMGLELTAMADSVTVAHTVPLLAEAVGDGLVFAWEVVRGAGTITLVRPDSAVYRAPDTVPALAPKVQVVVADGDGNARSATVDLTVLPYVPTDTPSYVGDQRCNDCHATIHQSWETTGHAGAFATLVESGHASASCYECHVVGEMGLNADPDLNNGGWDDVPLEKLQNVQCENCHGPGSNHPSGGTPKLTVSMDAAVCGSCHNGPHHPTYEEWQQASHSVFVSHATSASCAKCHNGLEAHKYLDDPQGYVAPAEAPTEHVPTTCPVCHNLHGTDNIAELRDAAATDVVLPNGQVIPQAGAGRLCMACHNGRRAPEDILDMIDNGSSHFGPHHSVQGDMLAGTGAYEDIAPGFTFRTSRHLQIEDGCVSCHTNPSTDPISGEVYTGHEFIPTVVACSTCHGDVQSFEDIGASEDYDGNGVIEGTQLEIDGLTQLLQDAIVAASDTPAHADSLQSDFEGHIGDTTISTRDQRAAAYNLFFVEFDGSRGVHNARYAAQLLQQSILTIDPPKLPAKAYIVIN